jgi:DNA-binding CsgD family transcriptional regulator
VHLEGRTVALRTGDSDATLRALSSAIGKTGARNRAEAVHVAEMQGWL